MPDRVLGRSVPLLINAAIMALCLCGAAGRVTWWNAWALIALSSLTGIACLWAVSNSPDLITERHAMKPSPTWDKLLIAGTVALGPWAIWITAGLEARSHGFEGGRTWGMLLGALLAAGGGGLLVAAMRANRFFSAVARVQADREHTVVSAGPYRIMRHPGYAGMGLFLVATPFVLNSRLAMIAVVPTVGLLVVRTGLEDRLLQRELKGYAEYARRVTSRLVPGIW